MPQAKTAATASTPATHVGNPTQWAASDPIAATPANASGHQGLMGSGVGSVWADLPLTISGVKPSERTASRIAVIALGSCVTVSTRCIRLNSMPATPAIPPNFLRNSASSVGQSICMMRMGVCTPPARTAGLPKAAVGAGAAQQASSSCACACGCGCGCGRPWSWEWSWLSCWWWADIGSFHIRFTH